MIKKIVLYSFLLVFLIVQTIYSEITIVNKEEKGKTEKNDVQEEIIEIKPMEDKDIPAEVKAMFEEPKLKLKDYEKDKKILKYRETWTKDWQDVHLYLSPDKRYVAEVTIKGMDIESGPENPDIVDGFLKMYTFDKKKLWEYKDDGFSCEYEGKKPDENMIRFSPNSKYIVTTGGGKKGKTILFNTETGKSIFLFNQFNRLTMGKSCAVSNDGRVVIGEVFLGYEIPPPIFSKTYKVEPEDNDKARGGIYVFNNKGKILWYKEGTACDNVCISEDGDIVGAKVGGDFHVFDAEKGSLIFKYLSKKFSVVPISIDIIDPQKIIVIGYDNYKKERGRGANILFFNKKGKKIAIIHKGIIETNYWFTVAIKGEYLKSRYNFGPGQDIYSLKPIIEKEEGKNEK